MPFILKLFLSIGIFLMLALQFSTAAAEPLFAVAVTNAPVLNSPEFMALFGGSDGKTLKQDSCGQLRSLEFIALPGTVFTIEAELKNGSQTVFKVSSAEYPYPSKNGYFIDSRSVRLEPDRPLERIKMLPEKSALLAALKKQSGSRYVWGGNSSAGVQELASWYPPAAGAALSRGDKALWTLTGVDCSGLLYEATGGYTPRNTGSLISFGESVPIAGKSSAQIAALLQPLDLIVWPGHVLIVIDGGNVIESRLVCTEPEKGVRIRPGEKALVDILRKRRPADRILNSSREFVVRRWYGVQ